MAAGAVFERGDADGDVVAAGGVGIERAVPGGDVPASGGVILERDVAECEVGTAARERGHHRLSQPNVVKAREGPVKEVVAGTDVEVPVVVDAAGAGEARRGGNGKRCDRDDKGDAHGPTDTERRVTTTSCGHGDLLDLLGGGHAAFGPARVRRRRPSLDRASLDPLTYRRKRFETSAFA